MKVRKAIPRKGKPRPKNLKRAKANHERAYGEKAEWIRAQPCLVCGRSPSEAAHVGSGGMGRKADSSMLVPLCGPWYLLDEGCHAESHRKGIKEFQRTHGFNLKAQAAKYEALWQTFEGSDV